jgi:hypothetical protein
MTDINLIPEEYKKKRTGLGIIFSKVVGIVLVLLILSLLLYGGLLIYKKSLTKSLADLKQAITDLQSKRSQSLEDSIYAAEKKLNTIGSLFENHVYWSKLFTKIEELAIADVSFSKMKSAFVEEGIDISLSGNAKTYTGLARQMISFKEDELFKKIDLTDLKLNENGGLDFAFSILAAKSILINQTENNQ